MYFPDWDNMVNTYLNMLWNVSAGFCCHTNRKIDKKDTVSIVGLYSLKLWKKCSNLKNVF